MTEVLYTIQRSFMRKTVEAIDRHLDASAAYLPTHPEARDCSDRLDEVPVDEVGAVDRQIRRVDPDAVVCNHRHRIERASFHEAYPLVHVRHGASIGRGEIELTATMTGDAVDVALAPGKRWARKYREVYPDDVTVSVVGIPEADALVGTTPPREKRVLYAPTNHEHGGGCYLETAHEVLDVFAGSDYELRFRPHPVDREEEPAKTVTEECRERIADIPNVTFDDDVTPRRSLLDADVLLSDYSGIVTEWLHTGRPLLQFTDVVADGNEVPHLGYRTSVAEFDLDTVDALYRRGGEAATERSTPETRSDLGIPMDGRAGERAASAISRFLE